MSSRAADFATQFEVVNNQVIASVTDCSAEQWRQASVSEEWPVAVVAHHIAQVTGAFAGMLGRLTAGETYTPATANYDIHASNAQHARDYADVGQPETLAELQANGTAILHALNGLSDEQLDRHAGTFGGNDLTVAQVIEYIIVGHTAEHGASIRATLGD